MSSARPPLKDGPLKLTNVSKPLFSPPIEITTKVFSNLSWQFKGTVMVNGIVEPGSWSLSVSISSASWPASRSNFASALSEL